MDQQTTETVHRWAAYGKDESFDIEVGMRVAATTVRVTDGRDQNLLACQTALEDALQRWLQDHVREEHTTTFEENTRILGALKGRRMVLLQDPQRVRGGWRVIRRALRDTIAAEHRRADHEHGDAAPVQESGQGTTDSCGSMQDPPPLWTQQHYPKNDTCTS